MKKILVCMISIFSLSTVFPAVAMKDMPALSYAEKAAIIGGKIVGAAVGAKVVQAAGRHYVDSIFDEPAPNLDPSDFGGMDLGGVNLDFDLNGSSQGNESSEEEKERQRKEKEEAERVRIKKAEQEGEEDLKFEKKFLIDLIKPGQRIGFITGGIVGYNLGGYLANRGIAWCHGVRYSTEKICRAFNVNVGQYRALVLSAEKKNLKEMRIALEDLYEKRFGLEWQKRLTDLLCKYDCYADYLLKNRKRLLSSDEKDLLRMIEVGATINAIYASKKSPAAESVESVRKIYQLLGFVSCRVHDDTQAAYQPFEADGDQYRLLVLSAKKRNLKEMRKALEDFYARRFGADWEERLADLLYKYDNYADYLFKNRKKSLSNDEKDLLRMIEVGAEINAIYVQKKTSIGKSVESARNVYQLLGFVPKNGKGEL